MKIKIYADGANIKDIMDCYEEGTVQGFTTNPTLLKKSGIENVKAFAEDLLSKIKDMPVSFEVFSDEFGGMEKEAMLLSSLGKNVYVKIPITNTKGESSIPLIKKLSAAGLKLNVTAITLFEQVKSVYEVVSTKTIISVFAGRIADTGIDPTMLIKESVELTKENPDIEILWASTRELLNIVQAENCGCHIITVPPEILKKLNLLGKDLKEYSLETVKMFYNDAKKAGYKLIEE